MKFIDFFAGIGGFRRGMELAGHECVGFCEYDKFATASYVSMHLLSETQREYLKTLPFKKRQKEILKDEYRNGEWYADDIRGVDAGSLPEADIWCYGSPCQSFSLAGKRAGLEGASGLVREIFRLLDELPEENRPGWLIYENVKGMFSSNHGWDYAAILSEMDRLGYDAEWQNINSSWFVPQNRERIYTVAHLRRNGPREILPVTGTDGKDPLAEVNGADRADSCFVDLAYRKGIRTTDCARTIQARYHKGISNRAGENSGVGIKIIGEVNASQDGKVHDISGIAKCHSAGHNNSPKIAIPVLPEGEYRTEALGGCYTNVTPGFNRGVLKGMTRTTTGRPYGSHTAPTGAAWSHTVPTGDSWTLKADSHPPAVALGIIDTQGRRSKEASLKDTCPILRSETHGNLPMVCLDTGTEPGQGDGIYVEMPGGYTVCAIWYEKEQCYMAIRRLTPRETFRLQGWTDDYHEKAAFVNSDTQLYKQSGNGVTVDVVMAVGERIAEAEREYARGAGSGSPSQKE